MNGRKVSRMRKKKFLAGKKTSKQASFFNDYASQITNERVQQDGSAGKDTCYLKVQT